MRMISVTILLPLITFFEGQRGPQPYPPTSGTDVLIVSMLRSFSSLHDLSLASSLIVEARVQSIFPTQVIQRGQLETDALLEVQRVFKGAMQDRQFVVAQGGGVVGGYKVISEQYEMMEVGKTYILFLEQIRSSRLQILENRNVARYDLSHVLQSVIRIDESKIHLNSGTAQEWRDRYEGMNKDQFRDELVLIATSKQN